MLSTQRGDFDDKKKDESPYPRSFSRWYALDYFLRPSALASRRLYVTLAATAIALVASAASVLPRFRHLHQAGPVSTAHQGFGQDCARCHDRMFQPVMRLFGCDRASTSDQSCRSCHHAADRKSVV